MHLQDVESLRAYHARRCKREGWLVKLTCNDAVAGLHRELGELRQALRSDLDARFARQRIIEKSLPSRTGLGRSLDVLLVECCATDFGSGHTVTPD